MTSPLVAKEEQPATAAPAVAATVTAASGVAAPAVVSMAIATEATAVAQPPVTVATATTAAVRADASMLPEAKDKPKAAAAASSFAKASAGMNGGRWTEQEHQSFLAGLRLYGREWKKVASKIRTRTSAQIRSHAQKYFAKLARDDEVRRQGGAGGVGALLLHPAGLQDGALAPSLYGYFSDGGSSAAPNSGDEDAADADAQPASEAGPSQRRPPHKRLAPAPATAPASAPPATDFRPLAPAVSATAFPFRPETLAPSAGTKKRSRSRSRSPSGSSRHPLGAAAGGKQRRLAGSKPAALERLPSQEELIEEASPNVRRRLSSLIEAELCALQVLSCYAKLQQHSQRQSAAGRSQPALGLAMISTEQLPPASSIY